MSTAKIGLTGSTVSIPPLESGASNRSVLDDFVAIYAADESLQAVLDFPQGTYIIDGGGTLVFPGNVTVRLDRGAVFDIAADTTVRFEGEVTAPPMQVFEGDGTTQLYNNDYVRPEWWGAVYDGVTDCYDAFTKCLASMPFREGVWSNGAALKSSVSNTVKLQHGRWNYAVVESGYYFATTLIIPTYKSIKFDGGNRHGTRIINGTGGDWIWSVDPTFNSFQWIALIFEGIAFDDGGLRLSTDAATINHSSQGGRIVKDCTFYNAPNYAIEVGTRYVWGWIERCTFDGNGGGVHFKERDSDLWRVTNCSFLREHTYPSVMVRSSGVTISECDFEVRAGTGLEQPFIGVGYPCTDLRVLHNRFGSEPTHPVTAIDFGELGDDTATDPMLGLMIKGNQFKGFSTPSDTVAAACFRFFKPVSRSQFIGNQIWSYQEVVQELYADATTQYGRYSYDNLWRENQTTFYSGHQLDRSLIFSDGGIGWHTDLTTTHQHTSQALNYTPTPDLTSASWLQSAAADTAVGGVGPDGSIPAYLLQRVAAGSCYIYTNLISVPEGEKLTFSVWAKAGSLRTLRLYSIDQGNRAVSSFSEIFILSDEWKRYQITLETPTAGLSYRFYIYSGADGTSETSGDFYVCDPRVDIGDEPYTPSWAQPLDYIDLADYATRGAEAALNNLNGFTLAMAHAVAAGRKLRITGGRTWYIANAQPVSGMVIEAHGAVIDGQGGVIFDDLIGGKYRIEGGSWTNCTTVFQKGSTGTSLISCQFVRMSCTATGHSFDVDESINTKWDQCTFTGSGVGIRFKDNSQNNINTIDNCQFQNLTGPAVLSLAAVNPNVHLDIKDCWFENITNEAIELEGSVRNCNVRNCYFESNGSANAYDILFHTDGGGQGRHLVVDSCSFATPDAAQTVQRIGLRGQTQATVRNCVVFLNAGQSFINYAVSNVYVSEFYRNYLSGSGVGTYQDTLFTDSATNNPHWSGNVNSSGVTNNAEQLQWRGRLQADSLQPFADAVSSFTASGTLVYGRINRVDPSAGGLVLDLPASPGIGTRVLVKNVTDDTTTFTVDGNGFNIDGVPTIDFATARIAAQFVFDGVEWTALYNAAQSTGGAGGGSLVLAQWNEVDTSEWTQVMGNGIGGVGIAGDWTLSASSFADTDMPALRIDLNVANADPAMWLFNGPADPASWDAEFLIDFWATISASGVEAIEIGIVYYYEDNDHWLAVNQFQIDDLAVEGINGASGQLVSAVVDDRFVCTSINEDNGTGDHVPVRIWLRRATGATLPSATMWTPDLYSQAGVHGAVFPASLADADWLALGAYAHKIGIYARNRTGTGPAYDLTRFRFKRC